MRTFWIEYSLRVWCNLRIDMGGASCVILGGAVNTLEHVIVNIDLTLT